MHPTAVVEQLETLVGEEHEDALRNLLSDVGDAVRDPDNRQSFGGDVTFVEKVHALILDSEDNKNNIRANAIRVVGNLTVDHDDNRKTFLSKGTVAAIVQALHGAASAADEEGIELRKFCLGALSNLCCENKEVQAAAAAAGVAEALGNAADALVGGESDTLSMLLFARCVHNLCEVEEMTLQFAQRMVVTHMVQIAQQRFGEEDFEDVVKEFFEIVRELYTDASRSVLKEQTEPLLQTSSLVPKISNDDVDLKKSVLETLDTMMQGVDDGDVATTVVNMLMAQYKESEQGSDVFKALGQSLIRISVQPKLSRIILDRTETLSTMLDQCKNNGPSEHVFAALGNLITDEESCMTLLCNGTFMDIIERELRSNAYTGTNLSVCALRNLAVPASKRGDVGRRFLKLLLTSGWDVCNGQQQPMKDALLNNLMVVVRLLCTESYDNVAIVAEPALHPAAVHMATSGASSEHDAVKFEALRLLGQLLRPEELQSKTLQLIGDTSDDNKGLIVDGISAMLESAHHLLYDEAVHITNAIAITGGQTMFTVDDAKRQKIVELLDKVRVDAPEKVKEKVKAINDELKGSQN